MAAPEVVGYRVYYGMGPSQYIQQTGSGMSTGSTTAYTLMGLQSGVKYYFAVTAVDKDGRESAFSNEVTKLIP